MSFTYLQFNFVTGGTLLRRCTQEASDKLIDQWHKSLDENKAFLITTSGFNVIKNEPDEHQDFTFSSALVTMIRRMDEVAGEAMVRAERNAITQQNAQAISTAHLPNLRA